MNQLKTAESSGKTRHFPRWAVVALATALVGSVLATWAFWRLDRPQARFERALAALEANQLAEVQRELEGLRGVEGYQPHRRFLHGALLLRRGKPYEALDAFGGSVTHDELRVRTLVLSGEALYLVRRYRDAVGLLNQAVAAEPDHVGAHRWLASAYYDLGLIDDAKRHLLRVAELAPEDPRPHRLLGLMYKDFEMYDQAVESYRESLRRDPQPADLDAIQFELAQSQIRLRRYDAALETLARCPPTVNRSAMQAECLYSAGNADAARRLLEESVRGAPAHLDSLLLLGTIHLESGEIEAAVEVLSQAVTARPKDYTTQLKLAQAYRRAGEDELADRHAAEAEALKALRVEFSELHGVAAAEPDNAEVRLRLGKLAQKLDRADLAQVWFEAALAIDPTNQRALEGLMPKP